MSALRAGVYGALTPLLAVGAFFLGFYALLMAASRADWLLVVVAAIASIAGAMAAFVLRKTRPNLTLVLASVPALLLAAVLFLR
ncbi:hypothetical protein [Candidatus Viadribacter manganicus]|uniref:Uncharacterized protein n=1 Tax=Candidatus Viadribacter manganicus TaxID=1759059 RepID=A0A1B1AMC1_9PROT|nr:hypothetical protein [Candidatus Viadribacter manganicus]ANP47703.1 hypothetical protein ATE48_18245 [Candidatus Viadribacter manganicus]